MTSLQRQTDGRRALRVAVYMRVSSDEQRERQTIETQRTDAERFVHYMGYEATDWYADDGVSGTIPMELRPDGARLLADLTAGLFDAVVVRKADRLGRSALEILRIVQAVRAAGIRLISITEQFDTETSQGQAFLNMLATFAQFERDAIVERTSRGRRARAEAGKYVPGNRVRYGYRWRDEAKTALEIDETKAPVVRRIFAEAADGKTLRQIAHDLTRDGIPTPTQTGNGWRHSAVRQILADRVYAGQAAAFRHAYARTPDGRVVARRRSDEEQIPLPAGVAPAIVDQETFEAVQDRLRLNKAHAVRRARNPEATLLRAGYVRCGYCGTSMAVRRGGRSRQVFQYVCKNHGDGFWRCDGRATIAANILDAAVWQRIGPVVLEPGVIEAEVERHLAREVDPETEARIARDSAELGRRQRNLVSNLALVSGEAARLVAEELRKLEPRREALDRERREIDADRAKLQAARKRLADMERWRQRLAAKLGKLTYASKRDALESLEVQARVWRADHRPRWEITANLDFLGDLVDTRSRRRGAPSTTARRS